MVKSIKIALRFIITICLVFSGVLIGADIVNAENKTYEDEYGEWHYYVNDDNEVIITRYNKVGDVTEVVIPTEIEGKTVTGIISYSFSFLFSGNLKSIIIPSSVTSIDHEVFAQCYSLERIIVDKNNKVYDSRCDCNAIIRTDNNELICGCPNTIIPPSVTSIGEGSFGGFI